MSCQVFGEGHGSLASRVFVLVFSFYNEVLRLGMLRLSEKGTQKCLLTNVVQAFGFRLLQVTMALCEKPQRLDSTHKMSIKAIVTKYTKVY